MFGTDSAARIGTAGITCFVAITSATVAGCAFGDAARRRSMLDEIGDHVQRDTLARERVEATLRAEHLDRASLVAAVLAQNPSVRAARAAWRAALERQPQEVALPDPMVEYSIAPLSIGAQEMAFGQVVSVSQRFPFPGRLALRSAVAIAEAAAEREQVQVVRLQLALMAALLFEDLYATERAIDVNEHHRVLLESLERAALALYTAGQAPQQDPIQARLEAAQLARQHIELEARRVILAAQINGLLHRSPSAPIPPTPGTIPVPDAEVPPTEALVRVAAVQRPELRAREHRIEARRAGRSLAEHEYLPDFGVMASYNSMWRALEHQFMVGVSIEVPIQLDARAAAVAEAEARVAEQEALRDREFDDIGVEVAQARASLVAAARTLQLYEDVLVPLARQQIEAAHAGYQTGRGGFQGLIDAERSLRELELGLVVARSEMRRAHARLQRAVGILPTQAGFEPEVDDE